MLNKLQYFLSCLQNLDVKQLSDQEIEALIKKQNEVLSTLEQLELRLSKLNVQFPDAKDSVPPTYLKQSITSSTPCNTVITKSEQKLNSGFSSNIENLLKVSLFNAYLN